MKNFLLLTLGLLMIQSNFSYGQYDWKPGFIIQNNGDTVKGYIDDRVISTNHRICYFKNGDNGEILTYKPYQIFSYRISDGKYFISKTIKFPQEIDSMFLEFLIEGKISMYRYVGTKERYFIEKDGRFTELENSEITMRVGDNEYKKKKNEYIGSLNILLQDAYIPNEIQKTKFQSESLINLARTYNEKMCPGQKCVIYEKEKKSKTKLDFGITIGMSNKTMEHGYFVTSDYELRNQASYYGGITLGLHNLPGGFRKFSVNGGALITSYYLEDKLNRCLNIPLYVGFKVIDKKIYPQVEVGVTNYFKKSAFDLSPTFGLGIHYRNITGPGFYIKATVEHIPAFFKVGAGIVF